MKRVLIANRGEIACRLIRTCRQLGIETVAVSSEAEAGALWLREADFGAILRGKTAKDSYLDSDQLIKYAHYYKVDAIHPGYGFLSENPDFAQRVREEGFIFVGPSSKAIEAMGSKNTAKAIAVKVGVPVIPGYSGADQSLDNLQQQANHIGYPLLIKATYGGGGKGMRLIQAEADFALALASCQREAESAFGNSTVMLEKCILKPRHIEVQVFADQHGQALTLLERDCSLQRRHQKVIEEAPASGLPSEVYDNIRKDALKITHAVKYEGAGTIEFLVDEEGNYYFLEMNTRLQVEHPVTEEILRLDLVALQLQVAQGLPLTLQQEDIKPHGHALEVRLYAEDPEQDFLPSTGLLAQFSFPIENKNMRIETGYEKGEVITPYYDPLLAKIIVWGETRQLAYTHLQKTLKGVRIEGVKTNLSFLKRLASDEHVTDSYPDTGFIDRLPPFTLPSSPPCIAYALTCAWLYEINFRNNNFSGSSSKNTLKQGVWQLKDGWRLDKDFVSIYPFREGKNLLWAKVYRSADHPEELRVEIGDTLIEFQKVRATLNEIWGLREGKSIKGNIHSQDNCIILDYEKQLYRLVPDSSAYLSGAESKGGAHLNAPMPGRIISVFIKNGDRVKKGQALLILEAMKMEHTIRAPYSGLIQTVLYSIGETVQEGAELIHLKAGPQL